MVSGQGHAALGLSTAGTPFRADAATVGRLVGDALGTTQGAPVLYTTSATAYNPGSDPGGTFGRRWGDYSFTSLDPSDDMTMWTIQEYCNAANSYGVRVVKLIAPPPATPSCGVPAQLTISVPQNVTITGTSSSGSGFFDPGAGFPNRLQASVTGGVTVNSVTYNNPTSVTLNVTATTNGLKDVTVTNPDGQSVTGIGCISVPADLSITKSDGQASAIPGLPVTYTIVASNAGPNAATGATVADTLPAGITGATWTCLGAGAGTCTASGSVNINDTVNLPVGGSVTYTLSGLISPSATGSLSNTATVAPSGAADPNPANNSTTDTNTLTPQADLSITKTDGQPSYGAPGTPIAYTIVASNAGPSSVTGATVADTPPAGITGATWTCLGAGGGTCTASGSVNINDTAVNLPVGGSVTYTLSGVISGSASGNLSNTATVTGGVTDPNPANNSATDTDTPGLLQADLSITKTDGQTTYGAAGTPIIYTITASNAGPSPVVGATVADTVPAGITGATWVCSGAGGGTCTASGSTNINDTAVNLPMGGSVTYTLSGAISGAASGNLSNTATVTLPAGVTDPNLTNNSATDTDTPSGENYFTVAPCRVVDTRGGAPNGGPVLQGQQTRVFIVATNCGIPASAKAVSVNLAVTLPTAGGNVRLFAAGQPVPTVSSINYSAGQTRGNNAVVTLDASGQLAAFVGQSAGTTVHLIIDVNGYFQ
jgi:uncharacterized repeat protein (TIGR01451 family)